MEARSLTALEIWGDKLFVLEDVKEMKYDTFFFLGFNG